MGFFDVCYIGLSKDNLFKFGVSPNKLFDYFYSSKPVIYAIDSGEYRPVETAQAGIQIPPEDPDRLADAILKLYQMSKEERDRLGENGKKVALEQYEYQSLATQLENALSLCIS